MLLRAQTNAAVIFPKRNADPFHTTFLYPTRQVRSRQRALKLQMLSQRLFSRGGVAAAFQSGREDAEDGRSRLSGPVQQQPCRLTLLDLRDNALRDEGVGLVAEALRRSARSAHITGAGAGSGGHTGSGSSSGDGGGASLKTLVLRKNLIGAEGAGYLADALRAGGAGGADPDRVGMLSGGSSHQTNVMLGQLQLETLDLEENAVGVEVRAHCCVLCVTCSFVFFFVAP